MADEPKTAGRGRAGEQLNLRVSEGERRRWAAVSRARGLALSAWIRLACNDAADEGHYTAEEGAPDDC